MIGAVAANFHEGSRSEYLAQYVFSSFGTSIPVPHQEDSGIDLYCTLLERVGQRAWPSAYYSVQVKSALEPWVFDGPESVRWFIEHPLPIFLCIVDKPKARLLAYQTAHRFAAWAQPEHPKRLELIPGEGKIAEAVEWGVGDTFTLGAPILDFTIAEALDEGFPELARGILKSWIKFDVDNLHRARNGTHRFYVPGEYETNTPIDLARGGWAGHGGRFREDSLPVARKNLNEIMGLLSGHYYWAGQVASGAILAIALRHLFPEPYLARLNEQGEWDINHQDGYLHKTLNEHFGMSSPPLYESAQAEQASVYSAEELYRAADMLLKMVMDELARRGITDSMDPPAR